MARSFETRFGNKRSAQVPTRTSLAAPCFGLLGICISLLGCSDGDDGPPTCTVAAPEALKTCVDEFSNAIAACYEATDGPCDELDEDRSRALDTLQASIEDGCTDGELGARTVVASVGRLRNACASEAASVAWRSYGGPQGAVWSSAADGDRACLAVAHGAASNLVTESMVLLNDCLADGTCDAAAVEGARASLASSAKKEIKAACSDLPALVAVDIDTFLARAATQVDCLTSVSHDDTAGLQLRCGPSNAQFDAPRGEWFQVVVDGDTWGTVCGDGSPYAFQIRLAPEGERLDRLVIGLQGGGVCLFEEDCAERQVSSPELFTATDDDAPLDAGIVSNDPNDSPFANWTKVYLPYCTQDVFAGGGVDEDLLSFTLPRYGSVNMRAAVQMVRDVIWKAVDAEGGDGFRPDEVVTLFGGFSAGGYGTLYNYHWFLDDLLWPRTIAFPDAGIALDNGMTFGVRGLGLVKIPVWGTQTNLPPYCFAGDCAVGENLFNAISPRLTRVPEQQMLLLTNPYDLTQQGDAFFETTPSFINELRSSYCDTKDLPGIQYYLTSVSDESLHVVTLRPELWEGEVAGEAMRDWFERAVNDPESLEDRAEEGDFVEAFPGVEPYPCEVAP